ncbi:venom acid phosphatase Acph-1-like [Cotesia typhae]|uniref:venom acid phosphatase Acph-1-like n=1 Tax=Cotesia typhae TaxID=2053667 RepID=UPI003D699208
MGFKLLEFLFIIYFITHAVSMEYELKFVAVLFRHGDRTPENNEIYPTDPYLHDDFHQLGRGQLTITGKQREYKLGQVLRDLYNDFLGDIYYTKDIFARSTSIDRTRMSLQLVLSALYPPKGSQVWNESLGWQPILTSYVEEKDDTLLKPELCPLYVAEYEKLQKSPELKKEVAKFRPLMQNLTLETGKEISTTNDLFLLYNGFMALAAMNRSLPKWSEEIFPHGLLVDGANLEYKSLFYNDNLKRLRSGMVLRNITNTMKGIVDGKLKTHQKMTIFSGHDANVASLLAIFSDYNAHVPRFSSSVNVELLHKNNNYFVRVRHYLGIPSSVVDLKVPGCDIVCPFNRFIKLMRKFLPLDEEAKCDKKSLSNDSEIVINY